MATPVGLNTGDPSWANWTMGGAWLTTHMWEHYLFSRDRAALERDYPVLKGAAEFCIDWLVEKDGELITSPGTSPENRYVTPDGFHGATLYGATADLALVRECLTDAVTAAKELGVDNDFVAEAESTLARLRPYQIGTAGNLQEWYYDWPDEDPRHRHQSHLIGAYPGHQILEGPLADAALKTLEIKGFETTGWSCGWLRRRHGDAPLQRSRRHPPAAPGPPRRLALRLRPRPPHPPRHHRGPHLEGRQGRFLQGTLIRNTLIHSNFNAQRCTVWCTSVLSIR